MKNLLLFHPTLLSKNETETVRNKEEKQGLPTSAIQQELPQFPVTCSAANPSSSNH